MVYKVGISTGWWRIAKQPELLGIAAKIAYGATAGVRFVQIDLETTSEFLEPDVDYQVRRMKDLGMEIGIHAELGEVMSLESSEWRLWDQAQKRLCETLEHAAKLGFVYVNVHMSNKQQLLHEEARFRVFGYQYPVVGFDGKPLFSICDRFPSAKKVALSNIAKVRHDVTEESSALVEELSEKYRKIRKSEIEKALKEIRVLPQYKDLPPEEKMKWEAAITEQVENKVRQDEHRELNSEEFVYKCWKNANFSKYILDNSEIGAYEIVANMMIEENDTLWTNICGGNTVSEKYLDPEWHALYNAALSARYIEGHLTSKWHSANRKHLGGMSIKEFCDKNKIYLLFEIPEASEGQEGLYRFYNPLHLYHLIKKLGSPYMGICIDFEHMLAHKMVPDEIIAKMPGDMGKQILLFHLGRALPYFGTAHVPIPRGSPAQVYLYKWLWGMRQKGWKSGYMIYERGGGQTPAEVIQDSVLSMRLIADELEKNTKPDELPLSFYGISEQNPEVIARQRVAMRDNFMAPVSGLLTMPDETHTFLGRAAVERGKAEEWRKGKHR